MGLVRVWVCVMRAPEAKKAALATLVNLAYYIHLFLFNKNVYPTFLISNYLL